MHWTVVAFLFCLAGFATSDPIKPPIPVLTPEPGIRFAPAEPRPPVLFEFFADITDPDGALAWPIAQQVQQYYGASRLDLVLQQSPNSYHRHGLVVTQGIYVIQEYTPDFVFDFVDIVHEHNSEFSTANTVDQTETQVVDHLADLAVEATGIDKQLFITQTNLQRGNTVTVYKYAVKRGAAYSPTYFVNGVNVETGTNYVPTFDEWIAFFDPIINAS